MRGSIIAATVLTVLPEVLRQFADYRMLVYAIVLIVMMLATNNPTLRNGLDMFMAKFGKSKRKGGEGQCLNWYLSQAPVLCRNVTLIKRPF